MGREQLNEIRLDEASVWRLVAAPHRMMFFVGATNVLLAMLWWSAWLVSSRWPQLFIMEYPPVFAGWGHAFVMLYQVLPSFFFGFLLTTFPKWTKQPEVARRKFVPVGVALLAGQIATLVGLLGFHAAVVAGVTLTLLGWTVGLAILASMLWREDETTWHARSCVAALVLGYTGIIAFGSFLLGASPTWAPVSIKIGTFGMALMVFFTVAHRMFPFFASNTVTGYQPWRPMWLLFAVWLGVILHLVLSLAQMFAWLWIPDSALFVLTSLAWWRWWPRGTMPGLLSVLFLGLAWLPIAMGLYTVDDIAHAATGTFVLGRAPAHALFVGFFGSVLVAMVTRVTQGHSGRPLVMPRVAWFAFVAIQLVAIVRVVGDVTRDPSAWFAIASVGWLVALGPWVVRIGRIYLTPRADRKPG